MNLCEHPQVFDALEQFFFYGEEAEYKLFKMCDYLHQRYREEPPKLFLAQMVMEVAVAEFIFDLRGKKGEEREMDSAMLTAYRNFIYYLARNMRAEIKHLYGRGCIGTLHERGVPEYWGKHFPEEDEVKERFFEILNEPYKKKRIV